VRVSGRGTFVWRVRECREIKAAIRRLPTVTAHARNAISLAPSGIVQQLPRLGLSGSEKLQRRRVVRFKSLKWISGQNDDVLASRLELFGEILAFLSAAKVNSNPKGLKTVRLARIRSSAREWQKKASKKALFTASSFLPLSHP
jgi:hypothetical protein